ncbi:trypsin-like serine peptidase [Primorskyibacter sp. 2E233]|uniref:trypsin-like serine peptidase n=1 Tax=Primorskyibacter sp. 2E233 TaxID=3413431 RepID=UPI003BF04D22
MLFSLSAPICVAQPVEEIAARVAEAEDKLRQQFEEGPVVGRFLERLEAQYVFSPDALELPVAEVENPDKIGSMALGALMNVSGTIAEGGGLVVEAYKIVSERGAPRGMDGGEAEFIPFSEISDEAGGVAALQIVTGLEVASQPGAMSVATETLDDTTPLGANTLDGVRDLVDQYANADPATQVKLARTWRSLRFTIADYFPDAPDFKAIYGRVDNYAAWRYGRIFEESASVVAIARAGQDRAICSGVLVAPDLVLTAGHCFEAPPDEYDVWFGYFQYPNRTQAQIVRRQLLPNPVMPPPDRWQQLFRRKFDATLPDYALVRIAPPTDGPLLPEVEVLPGQVVMPKPQCLRSSSPQRGDPIYVVGYPQARPATVHDNAKVEFPFRILDGPDFDLLRMDVGADFVDTEDYETVLAEFERSYVLGEPEVMGIVWRRFYDIREGGQPRMGIVADTFRGNSGGPVFDHENDQCVVGILNKGMPDTGKRRSANWKVHERVLPVTAIIEDLQRYPEAAALIDDDILDIRR